MGLANQAATPGRTSLLEAVNICLAVIGEAPINTLDAQQIGEAAQAERTLLEYHKEGQVRGWGWNRESGVAFQRDETTDEVLLPGNVVRWAPDRLEWNNRFQARGGRVYDTQTRSYAIAAEVVPITADITTLLSWDECPEAYNRWATIRAARVFSNRAVGNVSTYQLTQADEDQAWADLLRIEQEQSQPNAVTGTEAWATFRPAMGLGRRGGWSGGAGWPGDGGLYLGGVGGSGSGGGAELPQPLGPDARPTFAGVTLSDLAGNLGDLCALDANGRVVRRELPTPAEIGAVTLEQAAAAAPVQSVALNGPAGWSVGSTNAGGSVTLSLALPAGTSLVSTADRIDWDLAYDERGEWNGGAVNLNPATGRASLQLGTAAQASTGDFATAAQGDLAASAVQPSDSRLFDSREWSAATIDQAEAEAGTAATRRAWTAQRVRQAVAAWWAATSSVFGRNWATLANAAAGRTELGLGTLATANAVSPPALGGTTPAPGAFTNLSASAELTLPSGAPATPTARDIYAVGNTVRHRDSDNTERTFLDNIDNLANLASPAIAFLNVFAGDSGHPIVNSQPTAIGNGGTGVSLDLTQFSFYGAGPSTGTTATGAAGVFVNPGMSPTWAVARGRLPLQLFRRIHFSAFIRIPTLSDATDTFTIFVGGYEELAGYAARNFVGAQITGSTIAAASIVGGVVTLSGASAAVTANTWTKITVTYDASSLSVRVNNGTALTIASGFPANVLGWGVVIGKTAGTNNRNVNVLMSPTFIGWAAPA
jgi:hypothetical protein